MLCSKGSQDFDRFTDRCAPGYSLNFSPDKATTFLEKGLQRARLINQHYFALEPHIGQDTLEGAVTRAAHKKFINSVNGAICFTRDRGGLIRPSLEQFFNIRHSGVVLDLDEAENLARIELGLQNIKKGVPSVWSFNTIPIFDL